MFAQVLDGYGDLDVLHYREVVTPVPAEGQIRVRVAFVALNPVEWKTRSGAMAEKPNRFPGPPTSRQVRCSSSGRRISATPR